MAFFERKWVLGLIVLVLIVGFNGVSAWMDSRDEKALTPALPAAAKSEQPETASLSAPEEKPAAAVTVHVCGAVVKPGVFILPTGSRITDALEKAGGFTPKADTISVNLAEIITDGQQIVIYEKEAEIQGAGSTGSSSGASKGKTTEKASTGLPVSINHGSLEGLMLLDGIGEKTAQKIMDYRKAQGGFKSLEELKNVPGIGDKKFEQIKNDVKL